MEPGQKTESSLSKAAGSLKKTLRRIFIAIVVLVILGLGFLGWSFYAAIYKWQSPAAATVEIEQGLPVQAIAQMLADNGVIRTPQIFSAYVRIRGLGSKVKAGEYEFPAGINANMVLDMLVKGQVKKYQLQIIEGWTITDIVKYLQGLPFLKDPTIPQEFDRLAHDKAYIESLGFRDIASLEGYLFPDTYEVLRPKTADEIVKRLIGRFREIYTPESTALADKLGMTQQQIVTLASIIEKETGKPEERPVIASVFWNRMKQNMPLQADPTVIYGIPNFSGNLTREDLDSQANPYNTYAHLGLPPGPICNPGKGSIDAALQPADTKYLYFVSRNDGTHVFAETLEEHQRNVAQYQLGRAFTGPAEMPTGEVQPTPPPGVTAIPPFVTPKPATPGIMPQGTTLPIVPPPAAPPAVPQAVAPQAIPGPSITPASPPSAAPAAPAPTAPPAAAMPAPAPTTPAPVIPAYPPKAVTPSAPTTAPTMPPTTSAPVAPTTPAPVAPTTPAAPTMPITPAAPVAPTTPAPTPPAAATPPPTSAVTPPAAQPVPAAPAAPATPKPALPPVQAPAPVQ